MADLDLELNGGVDSKGAALPPVRVRVSEAMFAASPVLRAYRDAGQRVVTLPSITASAYATAERVVAAHNRTGGALATRARKVFKQSPTLMRSPSYVGPSSSAQDAANGLDTLHTAHTLDVNSIVGTCALGVAALLRDLSAHDIADQLSIPRAELERAVEESAKTHTFAERAALLQ